MKLRKSLTIAALVLVSAASLAYLNRLTLLQYTLGWYMAIVYPRDDSHPIEWQAGPAQATVPVAQRPPNIIVILADDMGYNDVTTYGGGYAALGAPTPNIDAIARDGVRFDQGYAGSAICTVSRAALLTGRYPWRFGLQFTPTMGSFAKVVGGLTNDPRDPTPSIIDTDKAGRAKGFDDLGMPPSELTMAKLLRQQGYHTVHIGKWHLGQSTAMRPNNHGFDESLNMEGLLYWPKNAPDVVNAMQDFDPIDKFLWGNGRESVSFNGGKQFKPAKYLTDYFTDEAVNAIKANKNRPFMLYLAHWGVHSPLQATKADYDALPNIPDHRRRVYAAMVRSVDRSVGRVLETLREQGLDDNTIVIFTSDNGAPGYLGLPELNKPFRGWKVTLFEGGLRVPYVAKWPGHIMPGQHYKQPVSSIDLLPTLVAAAGAKLPTDRVIDGVNLLPFLGTPQPGKTSAQQATRPLYWLDGHYRTVQDQGWKLIMSQRPKKNWLFNLNIDPTEQVNLAQKEPQRVAQLKAMLDAHQTELPAPLWEPFLEGAIYIDKTLDQKKTPDDEYTYWVN